MTPEERNAYRKKTAERIQIAREKEIEDEKAYFEKITTGNNWRFFAISTFITLIIGMVLTVDHLVDGKTTDLPSTSFEHRRIPHAKVYAAVWVGNDVYRPHYRDFVSVDFDSFRITKSLLTGAGKRISFEAHTLDNRTRFTAYRQFSIFQWFPYLQIMLLIPLLVFLLKRQAAWFKFMRHVCILLIFPGSLIILIYHLI